MRWTKYIVFLFAVLLPLTMSNDEAQTDHDSVDKEYVIEDKFNTDEHKHPDVGINPGVVNTEESSTGDSPSGSELFEKIDKIQSNADIDDSIVDKGSMNGDVLEKISGQDSRVLQDENVESESFIPSDAHANLNKANYDLLEVHEEPPASDKDEDIANPTTEQRVEETLDHVPKAYVDDDDDDDDEDKANGQEMNTRTSPKKQRYFPLLYTFGSMFSSFLAEFGDVSGSSDSSSSNSSTVKNSTSEDGAALNSNNTVNGTDQGKKTRFQCALQEKNSTNELNQTAMVRIINSTELLEILNFSKNQKSAASPCVLVMFYTKWCHFSAQAAPEYNALARAFPQLDVLAVDTSHFSYLNAKFGTVAVPNIMIFHSRSAVRFNHTARDLDHFIQFVHNNTGIDPTSSVAVLPEDFEGPLSSKVVQGRDWLLWLAWAFILVCSIYGFFFSLYGQAVIMRLRVLWAEHQHIE